MKVAKAAPRRLAPPVASIATIITQLRDSSESELMTRLEQFDNWTLPRGDMFHWVAVLDRFDVILERLVKQYRLDQEIQLQSFTLDEKRLIVGILKFSRLLVENCTNRNIYNSYERHVCGWPYDKLSVLVCNDPIDITLQLVRIVFLHLLRIGVRKTTVLILPIYVGMILLYPRNSTRFHTISTEFSRPMRHVEQLLPKNPL
ncbi:hypothetical protein BDF22DRAFT_89509 [Syncephalis plumigaleata]|nr:hypothetical protein BDF22DRAFT_89509 [Syncephalis plumigaleata]